jgi:hypothetical protein
MEETSGSAIDDHSTNDLTETGTISSVTGKVLNARDCGNSEYFSHADNPDLSVGNLDFTWAFWVKFTSLANNIIISKFRIGAADNNGCEYRIWRGSSGRFEFDIGNNVASNSAVTSVTFGTPSTGNWYYVVAWHDSVNNRHGISVNDLSDTIGFSAGGFNGDGVFYLGTQFNLIGNNTFHLNGAIDEVGFWKRVLTAAERTELYNMGNGRDYTYIVTPQSAVTAIDNYVQCFVIT